MSKACSFIFIDIIDHLVQRATQIGIHNYIIYYDVRVGHMLEIRLIKGCLSIAKCI